MSFRQNGRYGHVPPAQYAGVPPQLPRPLDSNDNAPLPPRPASSHVPYPRQDELFMSPSTPQSTNQYTSNSQSPPIYNPQQFARPQPSPPVQSLYNHPLQSPHAPYIPSNYPQSPTRQQTNHNYAQQPPPVYPPQQPQYPQYTSHHQYQSSIARSPPRQLTSPARSSFSMPTRPVYDSVNPSQTPLPPVPSNSYGISPPRSHRHTNSASSYREHDHRRQEMYIPEPAPPSNEYQRASYPLYPQTQTVQYDHIYQPDHSQDHISTLQRHPTGRGLPQAPIEDHNNPQDDNDSWSGEDQFQEETQDQLEAAIMNTLTQDHLSHGQDLLDGELGPNRRPGLVRNPTGIQRSESATSLTHQTYPYDYDDDDSDFEAQSGIQAMRLAEEEEARMIGFASTPYLETAPPLPPKSTAQHADQDSGDSDYANVDMGMYDGGYNIPYNSGNYSEAMDQSRPLPMPHQVLQHNSSDSYSYEHPAYPGDEHAHRQSTHRRGLSFDEGDEPFRVPPLTEGSYPVNDGHTQDDMPDMFYHPGMSASSTQRPLPQLPQMDSMDSINSLNHPELFDHSSYSSANQASYHQEDLLSPNAFARSASHSSHSNTPQVVPPVRSRTDAEERQARARAQALKPIQTSTNAYDGHGLQTPVNTLGSIALPLGRRRKITPASIRPQDFDRCRDPWALSALAAWLREMCGGETGDGEGDLREKTVAECLVVLFTHKVPTMNTADAEALSDRLVTDMFAAGVLIRDEEWVKFGEGVISGVLWQMTGSGCYAPRVHEEETGGRCYSHHCSRTLKKLNLSLEDLEPAKNTVDWFPFFNLTAEAIKDVDKKEIHRQNALHEIVQAEDKYMAMLNVTRKLYRDQLQAYQPPIITPAKLPRFIAEVFGNVDDIKTVNSEHLLAQLKYRQQHEGPWISGFGDIFREWVRKAKQVYLEYASGYSRALYLVRRESEKNILFRQFLEQVSKNALSNRLGWDTYIFAPLKRLQQYTLMLREVLKSTTVENEEKTQLVAAIDEVNQLTLECDHKVDEMMKKVQLAELSHKLFLRPGMRGVALNLDHLGRELVFSGDLQRAGTNRFTWLEIHALLFDNYLVLAKTVRDGGGGTKKEMYDVSKLPIPMQLLVLESTNDEAVRPTKGLAVTTSVRPQMDNRSSTRASVTSDRPAGALKHTDTESSVASGSSVAKTASITNLESDARLMFPFRIRHLGKAEVYTLYAPSAANRAEWCRKLIEAKEKHAASLFTQNAEPFKLKVIADSAFVSDSHGANIGRSHINIRGTPLDRAIREMEREHGPVRPNAVCRAAVNCATTFTCFGKTLIAIGTDYGVYTAEEGSPRGWQRSLPIARVTQITIIEEFFLCLIIADKSLIAYHLDMIVSYPTSHDNTSARRAPQKLSGSKDVAFFATARMKDRTLVFYKKRDNLSSTFKVLEPVFQKSTEKKSRLFGRSSRIGNTGSTTTEFFREFDEFYIPSDCYGINLFHTYIAIATTRGFELLTLDRKQPLSIPDLKSSSQSTAPLASRLSSQKPLGMFRLSSTEFLLVYEECGVYIDRHGEVSRSVILEFVGKAEKACLFEGFLVLFCEGGFVEIRGREDGRLRQIIIGREVRCLDAGEESVGGVGTGEASGGVPMLATKRDLKLAMMHPELPNVQLILEMCLNSGVVA